jgi:hypothetical protein
MTTKQKLRDLSKKMKEPTNWERRTETQAMWETAFVKLIVDHPELYGAGGKDRNWLEREAEKVNYDIDRKYGWDFREAELRVKQENGD